MDGTSSTIAEAFVTMRPDLTKFQAELEEGMKRAQTTVTPKISLPTTGLADAARSFADNVGSVLSGGLRAVTEGAGALLKNVGSGLVDLGRNIGSGLLTGLKNTASAVTSLAQTIVKSFAVIGVAAVAAGGLMLKGAAEEEQSIAQLSAAVKAAGGDWETQGQSIEKYVMGLQRMSGVAHDDIRPAFSLMIAQTSDVTEAMRRMPFALDLARGANIDLATASRLVGKVSDETVMVLSRLGIVLEKDATEADVFAAIQQRFGGQAAAFAKTAIGGWQGLRYEFDEIVETLGTGLLPVFGKVTGALTGFLRGFADSGQLAAWSAKIAEIAEAIGEMFEVLTGSKPEAGGVLASLIGEGGAELIMGFLATLRDTFQTTFSIIGGLIEGFRTGNWTPLVDAITSGAEDMLARFQSFGETIGAALGSIAQFIIDNGPAILAQLGTWAQSFLDWVGPLIPQLLAKLGELLTSLFTWISANAPTIVSTLASWIGAFLQWVAPLIPPLLGALGSVIGAILNWVVENAPKIIAQLVEWAKAFLNWVIPMIPDLLKNLGSLLTDMLRWVSEHAGDIGAKLAEWVTQFVKWILTDALPKMLEEFPKMMSGIASWITNDALPLLAKALTDFAVGFIGKIVEVLTSEEERTRIWNSVLDIGRSIVEGIWSGITSLSNWLWNQVWGWIRNVIPEPIRKLLGISSPSRLMEDYGEQIVAGLAQGIEGTLPDLDDFIPDLIAWIDAVGPAVAPAARELGVSLIGAIAEGVKSGATVLSEAVRSAVQDAMEEAKATAKYAVGTMTGGAPITPALVGPSAVIPPPSAPSPVPGQPGYRPWPWESPLAAGANVNPITGAVDEGNWVWINGIRVKLADGVTSVSIEPAPITVEVDGESIATAEARYTDAEARRYGYNTGVNR